MTLMSAIDMALGTVNASLGRKIDAATLRACLAGAEPVEPWFSHLDTLFAEVPLETIERVIAETGVPPRRVLDVYRQIRDGHGRFSPSREHWLAGLADAA